LLQRYRKYQVREEAVDEAGGAARDVEAVR